MQKKTTKTMEPFLNVAPKSAGEIGALAHKAIAAAETELRKILSVPKGEKRTRANTLEPLNRISIAIKGAADLLEVISMVHPAKAMREAAEAAVRAIADFMPKIYLDPAAYIAVRDVPPAGLDRDAKRFREKEMLDFKMSGAAATPPARREIKQLIKKSVKIGQTFDRNIRDDVRYISIPVKELRGMPDDYVKAHPADKKGMVRLSTQYPDYFPFMQYAGSVEWRKKFYFEFANRAWPKNDAVLRELLAVRQRLAQLLGFKNWADYVTVTKMIGSGTAVQKFINRVAGLVAGPADRDYARMLARKQKNAPGAKEILPWETAYYDNLLTKEVVGLDSQTVREYFPFAHVKDGLMKAMGRLFGLTYRRAKVSAWHKDVEAYDTYRGKQLIGRFYLDLHPREGKYGHACECELRPGISGLQLPEAALICNFSRDLMSYGEVETFFHEFGHLMHNLIGGYHHWCRFSGVETERDFVEAPSQMLEAWALDAKTLKTFARHHMTGAAIPNALISKMQKADSFNRGLFERRQMFLTTLSLAYHCDKSPRTLNFSTVAARAAKKFRMQYPKGSHSYASFDHLNGYSAVYYTYAWSRAISEDILGPFKKRGMYDAATARRYRDLVLAPGGSKDARELLRDFLGREWNLKAFEKWLKA